ncbi:GGDEF domain-containing protein [Salinimonas chungwhensis]|uniref:GGDEF domain-containing protein n=1 Tax=Salinimonas chungwhensis TaxID=265425 RepID=UPI00037CF3DB|nr:GGDEF domain-containing protein [Salinimonas chungwhensis]
MYLNKDIQSAITKFSLLVIILIGGGVYLNSPPALVQPLSKLPWLPVAATLGAVALSLKLNQQRILNAALYLLLSQVILFIQPSLLFTDIYQISLVTGMVMALAITLKGKDRSVTIKGIFDGFLLLAFMTVVWMLIGMAIEHFLSSKRQLIELIIYSTVIMYCIYRMLEKPTNNNFIISVIAISHTILIYNHLVATNLTLTFLACLCICLQIADSHNMAYYDELTGIKGRRGLSMDSSNLGTDYTVAMADVDHFKKFNDTHGHEVGDQVLKMVAQKFNRVGGGGKAYRYGGEEFTLLFPGKSPEEAKQYLEEVRLDIEQYPFRIRNTAQRKKSTEEDRNLSASPAQIVQVTVSIGATSPSYLHEKFEKVQSRADELLYEAKHNGRNNVVAKESNFVSES